jgi:hypothetical protein
MILVKTFKYELIKIVVFLFLFALSIFFVATTQDEYYTPRPKQHFNSRDSTVIKNS